MILLNFYGKRRIKPTLAQLVERRTVVCAERSLGRWFESGRWEFVFVFFFVLSEPALFSVVQRGASWPENLAKWHF